MDPAWDDPAGVPIDAFIFGGRLSTTFPLVYEARDWEHGVYMAATMGSEATAAAVDQEAIRRDPMAMLPFCGYNMADYWNHWLSFSRKKLALPKIFRVNWFRKDEDGNFIWPGFGENMRVLEWVCDRVHANCDAVAGPLGNMPRYDDLNWTGLDFTADAFSGIMDLTREAGSSEAEAQKELFDSFAGRLPEAMEAQRQALLESMKNAPEVWRVAS